MKGISLTVVSMIFLFGVQAPEVAAGGVLDGKTFVGDMGKKGDPAGDMKEELTFRDGKMHSLACDAYGYGDGAYAATVEGAAIAFGAQTVSPTDGTMVWKGTVEGNLLSATAIQWKIGAPPGEAPGEYWAQGQLEASAE